MTVIDAAFDEALNNVLNPRSRLEPRPWLWPADLGAEVCWGQWARTASSWLQEQGVHPRDAVVIVPVGAVLAHARRAWSDEVGGWGPAVETVASLISANSWRHEPAASVAGHLTLDVVVDRLLASHRLAKEPWCRQWVARDPRGFDHAMAQVVDAAHTWVRRAQAIAPSHREAYWQKLRVLLGLATSAPVQYGSREKLLLAWALEWAVDSFESGWPSDVLFNLPSKAYIGVSAGEHVSPGTEAHLMLSLMAEAQHRGTPCSWTVAQGAASASLTFDQGPSQIACLDSEDEARHAAAVILDAVNASRQAAAEPVALIALDRSLVRRVRAMLDGAGARVADETGWRLSTTRAAAVVTRLLQAAHPQATTDDLLDWLKSGWVQLGDLDACDDLESWFRQHGWLRAWDAPVLKQEEVRCPDAAQRLWHQAQQLTQAFRAMRSGKKRPLRAWLQAVLEMLQSAKAWDALNLDEAGTLVSECLHLSHPGLQDEKAWQQLLDHMQLDGVGFGRWVHDVLENTTFRPAAPAGRIDVVITPMARAVMRPFYGIVIPGADARQLGGASQSVNWLGPTLTRQMLLATPEDLREAQWEAFGLLMSRNRVTCLYRQGQGTEPMEASPWLTRWANENKHTWSKVTVQWLVKSVDCALTPRPLPRLDETSVALLPSSLSATSYEALRQCPYRFFAQSVLKLRDVDELEEGIDRSDYGTWLHEVIRLFHVQREQMLAIRTPDEDVAAWLQIADQVMADMGLNGDATRPYFLPYRSVLPAMATAYVRWLHGHEQDGWRCVDNESSHQRGLPLNEGCGQVGLKGQIDRIDVSYRESQRARMVIDYKSGSLQGLREKVKRPLEDTQLPFYAALVGGDVTDAAYLHLDAKAATLIRHPDVQDHADQLLDGLMADMSRIKLGAAMPALGDAAACTYCAARGLCRKDHWPLNPSNGQEGQA